MILSSPSLTSLTLSHRETETHTDICKKIGEINFKFPLLYHKYCQFSSVAQSCLNLCDPMDCSTPGFPVHHQLLKLAQIHVLASVMPSNHLILCHPFLLPPSIFPSIRVFSNESALRMMWPKYWSFSFSISPPNECSGLISFRIGWLDLLEVQRTFKSLLQHHSSKTSIIQHSAFFVGLGSVNLESTFLLMGRAVFPPCCLT